MRKFLYGLVFCFVMLIGISGVNAEEYFLDIYDSSGSEIGITDQNVYDVKVSDKLIMKADLVSAASKQEKDAGNVTVIEKGVNATWTSSDTNVATIDNNGKITIKKYGKFKITGSYTKDGATYKEEMNFEAYSEEIRFEIGIIGVDEGNGEYSMPLNNKYSVGEKLKLTAGLTEYTNGNTESGKVIKDNVNATWTSSNTKVATVDSKGIVIFKGKGKTKITATYTYEGKTYTDTAEFEAYDEELVEKNTKEENVPKIKGKQTSVNPATGITSIALLVIGTLIGGSVLYIKKSRFI